MGEKPNGQSRDEVSILEGCIAWARALRFSARAASISPSRSSTSREFSNRIRRYTEFINDSVLRVHVLHASRADTQAGNGPSVLMPAGPNRSPVQNCDLYKGLSVLFIRYGIVALTIMGWETQMKCRRTCLDEHSVCISYARTTGIYHDDHRYTRTRIDPRVCCRLRPMPVHLSMD